MTDKIKKTKCDCNCFEEQAANPSRRDFIKKASTLTIVGGTAILLEACGGGGSPTSSDNGYGGGDTGGGGDNSGGGNTGYNYDPATGVITIDT